MHLLIKSFVLFVILAIFFHLVSGQAEDFGNDMKITYTDHEAILKGSLEMKARKLLVHDVLGDYNDGGPNYRHDSKKGKAPGDGGSSGKYP